MRNMSIKSVIYIILFSLFLTTMFLLMIMK